MSESYCPISGSAGALQRDLPGNTLDSIIECNRCGGYRTEITFLAGAESRKGDPHYQRLADVAATMVI